MTNNFFFHDRRDADFRNHCIKIAKRYPGLNISAIVTLALEEKPERYHISFDTASRVVHKMLRNHPSNPYTNTVCRALAEELTADVRRTMADFNCTLRTALTYVLNNKRPSRFHISYRQALRIARRWFCNTATAIPYPAARQ